MSETRRRRRWRASLLPAGALLMLFGLLWLPLGQAAFLDAHWMKVGAFIAPAILFCYFSSNSEDNGAIAGVQLPAVLLLCAYLAHQVEEHWVDLLGRAYPLYEILNELLREGFGDEAYGSMTPRSIFFINTSVVWFAGFLAVWRARSHAFPMVAMAGVVLVNGVAHVAQAVASLGYNPGLLSGAILFIPLAGFSLRSATKHKVAGAREIIAGLIWGVLAHVILIAGVIAANVHGIISEQLYLFALVAWGALPCVLFRRSTAVNATPIDADL